MHMREFGNSVCSNSFGVAYTSPKYGSLDNFSSLWGQYVEKINSVDSPYLKVKPGQHYLVNTVWDNKIYEILLAAMEMNPELVEFME